MTEPPIRPGRLLAGPYNARLGPAIHAFNLPAVPTICVGASPRCDAVCYAKAFLFQIHRPRHDDNYRRSLQDRFVGLMVAEIRRHLIRVVRVHTAGDFYDAAYVTRWDRIARACPHTAFFAYTRSWRHPEILAELAALARRPNLRLWFSEDRDTGRPPVVPGVRRVYLLDRDEAEAAVPPDTDLVFRIPLPRRPGQPNSYERPAKRIRGVLVCPKEQGVARRVELTCSTCRICFTGRGCRGRGT
jgi:Gene product 88